MQQELLIAILAGLGGMLGWGFADFFAKKTIDEIGDIVSLVWAHLFGTIVLFISALYLWSINGREVALPGDWQTWFQLLFFGALQATIYFLVYRGFSKGKVGLLSPVFSSFSGLTAVLSVVIFGELLTGRLVLALITVFLGILLLNIDVEALRSNRINFIRLPGFREVAIATLLAAFWTLFWDKVVGGQDWVLYAFFMYGFMTFTMYLIAKVQGVGLEMNKHHVWKFLVLIGLTETVAYLAISFGYSATTFTSIIALLSGAFSLPTIILARAFLKEKITAVQTVGSVVIIAGIMILSLW